MQRIRVRLSFHCVSDARKHGRSIFMDSVAFPQHFRSRILGFTFPSHFRYQTTYTKLRLRVGNFSLFVHFAVLLSRKVCVTNLFNFSSTLYCILSAIGQVNVIECLSEEASVFENWQRGVYKVRRCRKDLDLISFCFKTTSCHYPIHGISIWHRNLGDTVQESKVSYMGVHVFSERTIARQCQNFPSIQRLSFSIHSKAESIQGLHLELFLWDCGKDLIICHVTTCRSPRGLVRWSIIMVLKMKASFHNCRLKAKLW